MAQYSEPSLIDKPNQAFSISRALNYVSSGAFSSLAAASSNLHYTLLSALFLPPKAAADYPLLNSSNPSYDVFVASPSNDNTVQADVNDYLAVNFGFFRDWQNRAHQIRMSRDHAYCVGNLSVALQDVGAAYAAGSSGASGLLTLIPTAGALIGAPARELWVLYKLMPIAGLLSMTISLGGNIVPREVTDFERVDTFSYQGFVATADHQTRDPVLKSTGETEAEHFASEVHSRALEFRGKKNFFAIWIGITLQVFWLSCILVACWFLESGTVVTWWCINPGWMYFWFAIVVSSSLLDNLAGVPFSLQWKIRISQAPNVAIDEDAPWVIDPKLLENPLERDRHTASKKASPVRTYSQDTGDELLISTTGTSETPFFIRRKPVPSTPPTSKPPSPDEQNTSMEPDVLTSLENGLETVGGIIIDREKPWSAPKDAFYVILSVKKVSYPHAFLRICSKFISIAVFAIGTGLFASSTLVTSLVAIVTTTLILCAGIFGRVTAMWIASEIMRSAPILHRVVRTRSDAAKYVEAILTKEGITCEILDHVILNGRCIKRFAKRLRWSSFVGVLAKPYDLNKLAVN